MLDPILHLSHASSIKTVTLTHTKMTWSAFLEDPLLWPTESIVKDGSCFVLGQFSNNYRSDRAMQYASGFVIDIDNKDGAFKSFGEIFDMFLDYTCYAYTTYSSTPKKPRARIVLPFYRRTKPGVIPLVSGFFQERLSGEIDACLS